MANMTRKDYQQLSIWLRGGATLDEVLSTPTYGLVENQRFTEAARRAYILLWTWCAYRHGGQPGRKQDKAFMELGPELFKRRMARAQRWADNLAHGRHPWKNS